MNGHVPTRGPARVQALGWLAALLAVGLIPHTVLYANGHTLGGYLVIHVGAAVFAGLAALILAHEDRHLRQYHAAYDQGRTQSIAGELERFERRTGH